MIIPVADPRGSAMLPIALAAIVMIAGAAGAQERGLAPDDSVMPIALFQAFTQTMGPRSAAGNETSVMVGRLPAGVAMRLPELPNARVLGMVSTPYFDVAAVEAPGTPESVRARIVAALPQRGWRTRTSAASTGGFVRPDKESPVWCGESSVLLYDVRQVDRDAVRVVYRLSHSDGGLCSPTARGSRQELPTLYNPEDVRSYAPECTLGSSSGGITSTMNVIASSSSPTALLEHYARQLAESGWRPVPSTGEGALVRRTWRLPAAKTDTATPPPASSGSPGEPDDRLLTITVQVPEGKPGCRALEMRLDSQTFR